MDILWVETERPKTVEDCILPDRLKKPFQEFVKQGEIPNLLLCGGSGVGKTSVSLAMCNEIGCDFIKINGSEENGIDTLRTKIKGYASSMSLSGGRKIILIDEADYMNPNSLQPALRAAIEEFADNASFIFTCNYKNRIIKPIHSRCMVIDFKLQKDEKVQMATQFFNRVLEILERRKITYDKKVIAALVQKFFPDFRKTLNELQHHATKGPINEGALAQISNVSLKEIVGFIKDKNYGKIDKWVKENSDLETDSFFRDLYDILYGTLKPEAIPQLILILAKYQYQTGMVADPIINILACLVEVMVDVEFK